MQHVETLRSAASVEHDRVQAHFTWVLGLLEVQSHDDWPAHKLAARARTLAALEGYAARGRFPRNLLRDRMAPAFVDDIGCECAVAHLMLASGDEDLVAQITRIANLAYVRDLDEEHIASWLDRVGLTFAEAGLIQPEYCPPEQSDCFYYVIEMCNGPGVSPAGCPCDRVNVADGTPCRQELTVRDGKCPVTTCDRGSCVERSCDDANPSTTDSCDPEVGCVHQQEEEGTGGESTAPEVSGGCSASAFDLLPGAPAPLLAAAFLLSVARRYGRSRGDRR